jgi:hypothetical protein
MKRGKDRRKGSHEKPYCMWKSAIVNINGRLKGALPVESMCIAKGKAVRLQQDRCVLKTD